MTELRTPRLRLVPAGPADLDAFHALITDEHVRRYMLDGQVMEPAWCAEHLARSEANFAAVGAGIWLATPPQGGAVAGMCGLVGQSGALELDFLYALTAGYAGQGYATEMARAVLDHVRGDPRLPRIHASVDAVNTASTRILGKLGFRLVETRQGEFGDMRIYVLENAG